MDNVDFAERLAKMWSDSRYKCGKSQDYMAKALGVSKKTIQNYEAGTASPNIRTALEWFDALGEPMYPYLMSLLYPEEISSLSADSDIGSIRSALHKYIDELDDLHVRELLYILYGSHGSSPTGALDMLTTYLHLPLAMRVCITQNTVNTYEIAKAMKWIEDDEHVLPKQETLNKYVATAKEAVMSGKGSYIFKKE